MLFLKSLIGLLPVLVGFLPLFLGLGLLLCISPAFDFVDRGIPFALDLFVLFLGVFSVLVLSSLVFLGFVLDSLLFGLVPFFLEWFKRVLGSLELASNLFLCGFFVCEFFFSLGLLLSGEFVETALNLGDVGLEGIVLPFEVVEGFHLLLHGVLSALSLFIVRFFLNSKLLHCLLSLDFDVFVLLVSGSVEFLLEQVLIELFLINLSLECGLLSSCGCLGHSFSQFLDGFSLGLEFVDGLVELSLKILLSLLIVLNSVFGSLLVRSIKGREVCVDLAQFGCKSVNACFKCLSAFVHLFEFGLKLGITFFLLVSDSLLPVFLSFLGNWVKLVEGVRICLLVFCELGLLSLLILSRSLGFFVLLFHISFELLLFFLSLEPGLLFVEIVEVLSLFLEFVLELFHFALESIECLLSLWIGGTSTSLSISDCFKVGLSLGSHFFSDGLEFALGSLDIIAELFGLVSSSFLLGSISGALLLLQFGPFLSSCSDKLVEVIVDLFVIGVLLLEFSLLGSVFLEFNLVLELVQLPLLVLPFLVFLVSFFGCFLEVFIELFGVLSCLSLVSITFLLGLSPGEVFAVAVEFLVESVLILHLSELVLDVSSGGLDLVVQVKIGLLVSGFVSQGFHVFNSILSFFHLVLE